MLKKDLKSKSRLFVVKEELFEKALPFLKLISNRIISFKFYDLNFKILSEKIIFSNFIFYTRLYHSCNFKER